MKKFFLIFFFFSFLFGYSQNNTKNEIKSIIDQYVYAVNKKDTKKIAAILDDNAGLLTIFYDGLKTILTAESVEMLISNMENSVSDLCHEEIVNYKINCSDILATVWCDYNFYKNSKIHHCGENAFQLYKSPKGWKIIQITDSRYKLQTCKNKIPYNKYKNKSSLIKFIDSWHKNASKLDFESYFDKIAENGVYIGTGPDDIWTKSEFRTWVNKNIKLKSDFYFETIQRKIHFNEDKDIAWFSEKLKTFLGVCHATGVAIHTRNGWKISYYQLSVTVPNKLMKSFINLKNKNDVE